MSLQFEIFNTFRKSPLLFQKHRTFAIKNNEYFKNPLLICKTIVDIAVFKQKSP